MEKRFYVSEKVRQDYRVNDRQNNGFRPSAGGASAPRRGKLSHNILPPPGVLEAYDDLVEGSAEQLFDMAEKEQQHRHDWEKNYLSSHVRSYRVGQFLGFLTSLTVVAGTVILAQQGDKEIATVLAAAGFGFLAITTVLTAKGRRFARRPAKADAPRQPYGKPQQYNNEPNGNR